MRSDAWHKHAELRLGEIPTALGLFLTLAVLIAAISGTSAVYAAVSSGQPQVYEESFSSSVFTADYSPDRADGPRLAPLSPRILQSVEEDATAPGTTPP